MRAKEYLQQIRQADIAINNKIAEKEALYTMAMKVTPTLSFDKGGGGFDNDKVGTLIAKIVDIENEINDMIDSFVDLKNKIIHEIEQLDDTRYYNLLHKRYVQYKDFAIIAEEMCYEYQSILNLHGDALREFEYKILY